MKSKSTKRAAVRAELNRPSSQALREEIARCAYLIWEQEGQPQGQDMTHWLAAEAQIEQMTGAQAATG